MQKCKSGVNLKKMLRQTKKTEWNRERLSTKLRKWFIPRIL
jgi:hypothetical protein